MKNINISKSFRAYTVMMVSALIITVAFSGCSDLDEDPGMSRLAIEPFKGGEEMQLAVTGAYSLFMTAQQRTAGHIETYAGDDMTTHRESNKSTFREYDQMSFTSLNGRMIEKYAQLYAAIRAANTVLVNSEETVLNDATLQDNLTGQAHFLRAMSYFNLARTFNEAPIVLDLSPDFEITRSSKLELYQQIESDLLKAEELLPMSTPVGGILPSKGTTRAMLARLYLDWAGFPVKDNSKYALAASYSKNVIDNKGVYGYDLVDDMASLYSVEGSVNSEGVFCVSFCAPCGITFSNRKNGKLGLPSDFGGWQESFAEIRFFEDFPEGHRKDATYHTEIPVDAAGNVTADVANAADFVAWEEFKDQKNPVFRKVVGPFEEDNFNTFMTSRTDYFMRYAEVLLIYAEASGRGGNAGGEAWNALNEVRGRAGLADVSAADGSIEDFAFTEKKWELAGEYLRWYDLVRMEKVEEALSNRNPRVSIGIFYDANGVGTPVPLAEASNPILGSLGTDNYFAPLPATEVGQLPSLGN